MVFYYYLLLLTVVVSTKYLFLLNIFINIDCYEYDNKHHLLLVIVYKCA